MSACFWKVAVGMALFGFVATLEVPAVIAKEPTAIMDQTKSFEGLDRDAAHEAAMKWIDDLNQHGPLRIKRIVVVERGRKWNRDGYLRRGRVALAISACDTKQICRRSVCTSASGTSATLKRPGLTSGSVLPPDPPLRCIIVLLRRR
jgi:hypothetical protein